jgi:general L-amino acid transport system permease protein
MSDTHAHTAFVRTEMLPEKTPPVTQTGAIKWLRENLFSSWGNMRS